MVKTLKQEMYEQAIQFYKEKHRYFHDERHLNQGMYILESLERKGYNISDEQYAAWIFHDAVYNIEENCKNEEKSVELFEKINRQKNWFKKEEVEKIKRIILDTETHIATINESKFILDVDMFSLSTNYDLFLKSRNDVKKEWENKFEEEELNKNIKIFLTELVNRPEPIYQTKYFAIHEEQARKNIEKYLQTI